MSALGPGLNAGAIKEMANVAGSRCVARLENDSSRSLDSFRELPGFEAATSGVIRDQARSIVRPATTRRVRSPRNPEALRSDRRDVRAEL